MIGDGSTPYEQLRISPTSTHTEIRNAYLKLRSDSHGEDLTKIQKAWELTWLPEHRATVDAFLFQLQAPNVTIESVADSIENGLTTQEWHEYFEEGKILEEAAKQTKHQIIKSIWLNQAFHEMFKRPMPTVPPLPALQPVLTRSYLHSQSSRDISSYATHTSQRNIATFSVQPPRFIEFTKWTQTTWRAIRKAFSTAWQTIRAVLTYPEISSQKTPATLQPDWTFIHLALAALFLFVLLSGMGYFIVNVLNTSALIPLVRNLSDTAQTTAVADLTIAVPSLSSSESAPTLLEEIQSADSSTAVSEPLTSQSTREIAAPNLTSPQITLTESPSKDIDTGTIENIAPTPSPLPTVTAEPVTLFLNTNYFINLRAGPGGEYRITQIVAPGRRLTAYARNAAGDWVQVRLQNGDMGWIFVSLVTIDGDLKSLPEVSASSL